MSSVDSRIVAMKFDNSRFERGVATTMGTLSKLKSALSFGKSTQSINELQGAANKFNMGGMGSAVSGVSGKFLALATVAITALSNITNKAVDAGINLAKSLTVEPIMDGFREYETKMGSIQTILSNTSRHGTTLKDVTNNLDDLNTYADKTIYSFSDMTRNIGLFTNAGIGIKESTSMIKGFSNEAAASGTNSQGAASAAYQLSQALSAGTIRLMDWRSLQNVGMGNKNMQNGLIEIADAMGTFEGTSLNAKKASDNFNASLEEKWLTADVMENYLKIQAGDLTKAQIKNLGLTDKQATAFLKQQKIAQDAATKVRTFTQLIGTLQEAAGSGWAQTFDLVLGDFNEATELFTGVEQAIGGMLSKQADARNKMIGDWVKLGGRDALIEGLKNTFQGLLGILKPVQKAFRDVFPAKTGKDLYQMTIWFRNLTRQFKMGEETTERLRRIFRGFFAILGIGWEIVKGVVRVFASLFGMAFKGSGGFLEALASIGDFFYGIHQDIKKGRGLTTFFEGLIGVLGGVGKGIFSFIGLIGDFFDSMNPLQNIKKLFTNFWDIASKVFNGLGELISSALQSVNFEPVMDIFKTGLLGGLIIMLRKFFSGGLFNIDMGGGLVEKIGGVFDGLTDAMKSMQTQIQSKTLLTIAAAIGLLTASVVALSLIDSKKLAKALTAMSVGFAQLLAAMAILVKISGAAGFIKVPMIAGAMVLLATSILVLSAAVKVLSTMSWEELAKGLGGVAVLLVTVSGAAAILSKNSGGMIRASVALMAIGVALNLLALAVRQMASLSLGEMAKGLVGIAGAMAIVAGAMRLMPKGMLATAAGLVAIGIALNLLAGALRVFGGMDIVSMVTGLSAMGGALVVIAMAVKLFPKNMGMMAASLVAVSVALNLIAVALKTFGGMSWEAIARGLVAMGASLAILAVGLYAMSGTLAGSAALLVAAAGMAVLAPALAALGLLSWGTIVKGLTTLAVALTILGVAGYLIGVASVAILALGAALLLAGAGFALAGAGALQFATAFTMVVATGAAGVAMLTSMLNVIISSIPKALEAFATGIIAFTMKIVESLPKFVVAMGKIISAILQAIINAVPKIGELMGVLMQTGLTVLYNNVPRMITVGFAIMRAFLNALARNIGQVTTMGIRIIVGFLNSLTSRMPQLVTAGVRFVISVMNGIAANAWKLVGAGANLVIKILNGLASKMPGIVTAGTRVITKFLGAIARKAGSVVSAGAKIILNILQGLSDKMPKIVQAGANVIVKTLNGIARNIPRVIKAGADVIIAFLRGLEREMPRITNQAAKTLIAFINGLTDAINKNQRKVNQASQRLAKAIIDGMVWGLKWNAGKVGDAAVKVARDALKGAKQWLGINSPSKVFRDQVGKGISEGMAVGITDDGYRVDAATKDVASSAIQVARDTLTRLGSSLGGDVDMTPVIAPVLDLSNIRKDAGLIDGMVGASPIQAGYSYTGAATIARDRRVSQETALTAEAAVVERKVEFNQYNTSPKALSDIEIYRNTKNQLSAAKGALST